jgi:uncharacterized protein (TIGR03437 family)
MTNEMWRNQMNYLKISMFGTMLCLLGLGFSDTALGQITTSPSLSSGMSFQVLAGGSQGQQNITIYTPNATTVFITMPAGQTWLQVNGHPASTIFTVNTSQNGALASATLPVQVNTLGLSNGQEVSATIGLMIANESGSQVSFPVSMTVGNQSLLTATPANLTFSAVTGNSFGNPSSTQITVSSAGQALTYNVSVATTTGGNWIGVTNTTNIPTNNSTAGFSVSVNAQNLSVGTYTGTVTLQSTSTADSTVIPVTIQVTAGSALNVTPTTLNNFIFQAGSSTAPTQTQQLMISTNSGSLNYQILATSTTGSTNWLIVSPNGGLATTTPQTIQLSLSYLGVASLPVGTYTINLAISPTASSGNTTNIPVTLVVSNNALLSVNNSNLSFSIPFGSTNAQQQTIQITSSNGTSIPYTVLTSASWLTTSPTSGTTGSNPVLAIFANATGQNVTTTPLQGTVTIYPANGDNYSIQIAVTLTVTSATTTLYAAPAALLFSYQTTQSASLPLQLVQLSSASTIGFTVTTTMQPASNCPSSGWLQTSANSSSTPATLSVGVVTSGMTAGFCSGQVIVTYNNGSENATVNIPVFVDIAATPLLTVTPDQNFGVVVASSGTNSVLQSRILMGSTDGSALGYSAFASTPNTPGNIAWLSLGNSQGNTQQYMQVFVLPSGLPIGTYTGQITISATNSASLPSGQLVIPVVLTISANTTVTVSCGSASTSCASLTFTEAQGSSTAPSSQPLTLTATGGSTPFTATVAPVTGGNWLHVDPPSGTASGTVNVSILANTLSVGTYTSNITLKFTNSATSAITIPVSLVVTASQTVTVAPTSLSFTYQLGSAGPATQTLNVTSTGGAASISVATTSSPAWLSVSPTSGQTGASGTALALTVSVTPSVVTTAQTYNGTITITPTGQAAITVPVTLIVTPVQAPQPGTIANSASFTFGPISPGELITIKGTNLGPSTGTGFSVGSGGTVSNTLAGVQVLFDSNPGTPIYVSNTQINVIVPYEIAGRSTTNVVVSYNGQQSSAIPQNVASQAPGIYTASSTGAGQASVLNQNGTLNGPASGLVIGGQTITTSPAAQGSVISVFMTGGGQTSPQSSTGTVTPTNTLYKIPGTVTATINGVNAPVQFAGAAPGEVTGVIQVNLLVPAGVSGSTQPLAITINGVVSPPGPTVSIQ